MNSSIHQFIKGLPKIELHMHIEGSLQPELMFRLAERNQIKLAYDSVEALRQAYQFDNLQSFLDLYYQGAQVLLHEQDFYDLAMDYFERCAEEHTVHTEVFFDPQTHTERGVAFETVINGLVRAKQDAQQRFGMSIEYIMCFLRHLSEASAFECLEQALPYRRHFVGVGLDSSEQGHPPEKFQRVFAKAKQLDMLRVAHAGEEGPAANIRNSLELLEVQRIDHGVRCLEDAELVAHLAELAMPLTVCPFSNVRLKVVEQLSDHPLPEMLAAGLAVTLNSDDPAYFGGYLLENFVACAETFDWSKQQVVEINNNALRASFTNDQRKLELAKLIDCYVTEF